MWPVVGITLYKDYCVRSYDMHHQRMMFVAIYEPYFNNTDIFQVD